MTKELTQAFEDNYSAVDSTIGKIYGRFSDRDTDEVRNIN
jgi:hypothetical protein